jgi:hypothetical protein
MIGNSLKFLFGIVTIGLLGFIAFHIFQDKYMQASTSGLEVVEERVPGFVVLQKIEAIGKIELVKYQMKDAVQYSNKAAADNPFLPDQKILLIVAGEAVGCIDFTKIEERDIVSMGDSLLVALPQPEICYAKINHQDCKVYDLSTARMLDKTELVEMAYKRAEKYVERMARESNLLAETRNNAELMLRPLLENLTGKRVIFSYKVPEQEEPELRTID